MKSKYAVTFEFNERQPLTYRGIAMATSIRTLAARAIDLAIEDNKKDEREDTSKGHWSSICIVLDRYDFMNEILREEKE